MYRGGRGIVFKQDIISQNGGADDVEQDSDNEGEDAPSFIDSVASAIGFGDEKQGAEGKYEGDGDGEGEDENIEYNVDEVGDDGDDGQGDEGDEVQGDEGDDKEDDDDDDEEQGEDEEEEDAEDDYEDNDEDEDEDDEYVTENLQKINNNLKEEYLVDFHPECKQPNFHELQTLTKIVRDETGRILDPLHRTLPILTKYERARVLGLRAKQINNGADIFVDIPDEVIDGYVIAEKELNQKAIPFIVRRPLPNGRSEYWKLADLEIVTN